MRPKCNNDLCQHYAKSRCTIAPNLQIIEIDGLGFAKFFCMTFEKKKELSA